MPIPTITVTGDVLPPNNVVTGGSVQFELSAAVSDPGAGMVVPRTVTTPILANGTISVAIWPNELGVFPTNYAVYVVMQPSVPGECESRILIGHAAFSATPATQDLGEVIAQQSGPIMVGDTTYPTIAAAVAAAQAFAADAGASAASAVAITGTIIGAGNGQFQNGSAAAPAVTFASDTNTGLYRVAADVLGLSTNGVERVRVTNAGVQVTGLLTGTAVTQSQTDTTVGRLTKVGDFGVGAAVSPTITLNTATAQGLYQYMGTDPNSPTGAVGGVVLVQRHLAPFIVQTAHAGSIPSEWTRFSQDNGATWSAWSRTYSQRSILGTVTQSAGQPTGALIERGSNADGQFTRWADGTQICWQELTTTAAINTAFAGGFRSAGQTWAFPAAFVAAPVVTGTPGTLNSFGVTTNAANTAAVSVFHTAVTSQASASLVAEVMAVGRWF